MTTPNTSDNQEICPAQGLLKLLAGKWKPEVFREAVNGPVRFSELLRHIEGANKQSLSVALRELEEADLLSKETIQLKPLHIEYSLTEKAQALIPVFKQLESVAEDE